jgi:hypothetical protein
MSPTPLQCRTSWFPSDNLSSCHRGARYTIPVGSYPRSSKATAQWGNEKAPARGRRSLFSFASASLSLPRASSQLLAEELADAVYCLLSLG